MRQLFVLSRILVLVVSGLAGLGLVACRPEVQGPSTKVHIGDDDAGVRDASAVDHATFDSARPDSAVTDTGTVITPGCNGVCNQLQATACTCDVSDPCDWVGDGYCDTQFCAAATNTPFDDSLDCNPPPPTCNGECEQGTYTTCTCAAADPCGWAGDGYCDGDCASVLPGAAFDDTADCGGPPPPPANACNGTCGNGTFDSCTCAASDPCGRAGNGTCDQSACAGVLATGAYNDSADCGGWDPSPAGGESYVVTAVNDNLDNGDLDVVSNALPGLGFTQTASNTNVSTSTLAGYLAQNLTVLYHTGHGDVGEVLTSNGSFVPGSGTINVQHTVFATCLTLQSYAWRASMGPTAQSLFGYTEVSYDYTDDEVAQDFIDDVRLGKGFLQAWYLSNASQSSLYDRWAAYVREGADIVEYSARVNRAPANVQALGLPLVGLDPAARVQALASLLVDSARFPRELVPVHQDAAAVVQARQMAVGSWSLLQGGAGTVKHARHRAEELLRRELGGLPEDAELDRVLDIVSRRGEGEPEVVGHLVRYRRVVAGLPVRGNGVADHLSVLVGGRGVVAWTVHWPERRTQRVLDEGLDVADALRQMAPALALVAKGPLRLLGARAVWGALRGSDQLVPAFAFETDSGQQVVVDARTGQLLL
ncbi:MAG: hypothetical protein ABIJ09_09585 [Pseudomonadota bacterium]